MKANAPCEICGTYVYDIPVTNKRITVNGAAAVTVKGRFHCPGCGTRLEYVGLPKDDDGGLVRNFFQKANRQVSGR